MKTSGWRRAFSCCLISAALAAASPAAAQWSAAGTYWQWDDGVTAGPRFVRYAGSPEGALAAPVSTLCVDSTTGVVWRKAAGTGTTGWERFGDVFTGKANTWGNFAQTFGVAGALTQMDSSVLRQRRYGQTRYRTDWYPSQGGTFLESYDAQAPGAWMPFTFRGSQVNLVAPTTITGLARVTGGGLDVGTGTDPGAGNSYFNGWLSSPDYASLSTGWRLTRAGELDVRSLQADELRVRRFIVENVLALKGDIYLSKSNAKTGAVFVVPSAGAAATLTLRDMEGMPDTAVFESGDTVSVEEFNWSAGSLSITHCWGVVTGYADLADGLQSWTFTRSSSYPGAAVAATSLVVDSTVLDIGVSGQGILRFTVADGAYGVNGPYIDVLTWSTTPSGLNPTMAVQSRIGKLTGVTGTAGEYGALFGQYNTGQYVRLGTSTNEIHGVPFALYSGATKVLDASPSTPYFAVGNPAPTSYSSGVGCWEGIDAGQFKWRCGDPGGNNISFVNGVLNVVGNITAVGLIADDVAKVNGVASATVASGAGRAMLGLASDGGVLLPVAATPSGSGLFLGNDHFGHYAGGRWVNYFDNAGNFGVGDYDGGFAGLKYSIAGGLALRGSFTVTGGNAAKTDLSNVSAGYAASSTPGGAATNTTAVGGVASSTFIGWIYPATTYINGGSIYTGTIVAGSIAAGTITVDKIQAHTLTADRLAFGTITADYIAGGTITGDRIAAGTIEGGNIDADAINGKTITGATFRTAASGARFEISGDSAKSLNGSGSTLVEMSGEGVTAVGTSSYGDTGRAYKFSGAAAAGMRYFPDAPFYGTLAFSAKDSFQFAQVNDDHTLNWSWTLSDESGSTALSAAANGGHTASIGTAANPFAAVRATLFYGNGSAGVTVNGCGGGEVVQGISADGGIVTGVDCVMPEFARASEIAALRREVADLRAALSDVVANQLRSKQ